MKTYGFDINPSVIYYNSSIRDKFTIIKLLIGISNFLNMSKPQLLSELSKDFSSEKIRLIIYIDKMSRIFIEEKEKIHTFFFPFKLRVDNNKYTLFSNDAEISNVTCSVMSAIFNNLSDEESLEFILEQYWDVADDLGLPKEEEKVYSKLITYLLTFESGYLRLDHDESERGRGKREAHPIDHIDCNYTDGASFKLGLSSSIACSDLIDILDINTPCTCLSLPRK